ncbi:protein COFACTOR ASSEMBLY OF COMPLEX C SUBUNIT B CCB3, chloroplastic isoform X2 [Phalaenopsis equestris]|uniref:protein COFACTOR ASSEMBLY OF COMPLEX C SUBUNIT B CCB3, chloroplastic isoform X2 n=1 Tax=Phalaenopsis equestris TaxID=78828 RepID=UPI0009E6534B|nr:protein COFACTOR ASSEMBLY OF COMPLEX C SUBUNIT B CCB3, chloroplastic isoform X2 [Phalaenopsis equestris]
MSYEKCRKEVNELLLPHPSCCLKHTTVACCIHQVQVTPSISHSVLSNMEAIRVLSETMQRFVSSHTESLMVADVDPQTAKLLIEITNTFLSSFGLLFVLRIVMSWYPKLPVGKLPYVIAYAPTEPFLVLTRKVIPPLGGVDVTPVVWFGLVSFLNEILVGPQGLLVLLSQQV